jgi:8-oxo-dGTP diphosphatase
MELLNDSREYPQRPVAAVGGVVIENRKALLIRRAKEPRRGEWSIPGGGVETGETLRDALRREIREETGLAVRVGEILEVFDRILPDSQGRVQYHYVLVDFVCSAEGGELKAASDVSEACWAARDDLERFVLRPDTLRVIEKAFDAAAGQ